MSLLNRRGQSVAEYAILFAVVIGAYVAMQVYARRGLQARVRNATDALTSINGTFTGGNGGPTANFASTGQYEPYYLETSGQTYQESVEQDHLGNGKVIKEKISDTTARAANSYQKQKGTVGRATADALWN